MLLSIIIPVYNRPEELEELLSSLVEQAFYDYEVVVVEDGSTRKSDLVIERYCSQIPAMRYVEIPNSGPSRARNVGAREALGDYLLILDSDVVLPKGYLLAVVEGIEATRADAFGGADAAAPDFSPMQQAVSYAMTSFLTTGGIRGASPDAMERFKPRSYNMGVRRSLFEELGGFSEDMRYGEDIDFSLRLEKSGAMVCLFPQAFVYHKRRVQLEQFFWQVFHSGEARIELERRHPGSTRLVHYLPAVFTVGVVLALFSIIGIAPLLLYAVLLALDAYDKSRSLEVALLAIPASFVQLIGYGSGFLRAKFFK